MFRQHMKSGRFNINEGNFKAAERCYWLAMELANDYDNPYRKHIGLIEHRLAEISARQGDVEQARWRFKKAASRIENNPVGLAICLRDHANFELLQGKNSVARNLLAKALKELEKAQSDVAVNSKKRLEVEVSVTRAFVARIDIKDGRTVVKAVEQLKTTAKLLREYTKKPAYELANLGWLIDALPQGNERNEYLARACEVSAKLKNWYKWGDFTALKYGKPVREAYRITTSVASFGINTLKDVRRHISSL